ncbi:MAG: hypothetical protein NVV57_10340 [Demequina sp.]|jgi:hypothetical protein|nr:hypothetical protein [Demequina sp.]
MNRTLSAVLYVGALVATVVVADLLFFRDDGWARLVMNAAIVAVFLVVGMRVLRRRRP